jgi:hypothetical protein
MLCCLRQFHLQATHIRNRRQRHLHWQLKCQKIRQQHQTAAAAAAAAACGHSLLLYHYSD